MAKKHKKSTMPAYIQNQTDNPIKWYWCGGDGQRVKNELAKEARNKRRLINNPEQPATVPKTPRRCLSLANAKPRTATRTRNYPQVRTINN